jgi:uncharacterized membrane protein YqjE
MTDSGDNLFSGIAAAGSRLRYDVGEMLTARAALAKTELTESARQTARCGITLTVALVLLLSAVPVAVTTLALAGATYFEQSPLVWLAASAVLLAVVSALIAWWTIRSFRRDFTGLRDTLAELREDLVWLQEWSGQADPAAASAPDVADDQPA